jgi:hypothetical protein
MRSVPDDSSLTHDAFGAGKGKALESRKLRVYAHISRLEGKTSKSLTASAHQKVTGGSVENSAWP